MTKPTLVIMAAGMGSRYGGLKQLDKIGPNGETIIEYSIYDAIKAGIKKVVFIIKKNIFEVFKETIGNKIEKIVETEYIFQELDTIEIENVKNYNRVKPWGTGHAVLCCKDVVKDPFVVINADDFYGKSTYEIIVSEIIMNKDDSYKYTMAGFKVENTLTEFGSVSRGICKVDSQNYLLSVDEKTKIKRVHSDIVYEEEDILTKIEEGTLVSMNIWGLKPSIFEELEDKFVEFLNNKNIDKKKDEFYLPVVIDELIKENKAEVKVLKSNEQWYGVTYKEDKEKVGQALRALSKTNYPDDLWREFKEDE
ncbi:nucleotidyltransferase family protein [Clostridium sp. B9]|uniref:nucleotidyltransferase family protein n=1 Tax=Clostridium sp. B9 TaxID=3423224 RepID=UPI003D2EB173